MIITNKAISMHDLLQKMLEEEQQTIKIQLQEKTRDYTLVEAESRARLLQELLGKVRRMEAEEKIDWAEPRIIRDR